MAKMKIQLLLLLVTVGLSSQSCKDGRLEQLKEEGATRNAGCIPETCKGGHWVPHKDTILEKCKVCNAWGDPHFEVFSGARFDWMGHGENAGCNYAMVQDGITMDPAFGVFVDFQRVGSVAYVGAPTTYQDDINTKVVLYPMHLDKDHENPKLFNVKVNGVDRHITQSTPTLLRGRNNIETSVYAWKHSSTDPLTKKVVTSCVRLYGKTKILVELCDSIIHIWAPPEGDPFQVKLGGLCGSTDSSALKAKQLVARNGRGYPDPKDWLKPPAPAFGNSWKAKEQTKTNCQHGKRKRSPRKLRSVVYEQEHLHLNCTNDSKNMNGVHHGMCAGVHKGDGGTKSDDHLYACKYDLCIVANDTEHIALKYTVDHMLKLHTEIHARTRVHNDIERDQLSGRYGFQGPIIYNAYSGQSQPQLSSFLARRQQSQHNHHAQPALIGQGGAYSGQSQPQLSSFLARQQQSQHNHHAQPALIGQGGGRSQA